MLQTLVISLAFVNVKALTEQIDAVVKKLRNIKIDSEGWKKELAVVAEDMGRCQ